ncbi:MAG: hypothetical protein JW950_02655 [Deltaproteobacteria bacterium]|nr:hypothetical protein [Deltaproteobacteria bacterium]
MKIHPIISKIRLMGNRRGLALLTIVGILLLIAVMIGAGLGIRGLILKGEKVAESTGVAAGGVAGAVNSVLSYASAHNRLPQPCNGATGVCQTPPPAGNEFLSLLKSPNDEWDQSFNYLPDVNLVGSGANICGRKTTNLRISRDLSQQMAFVVWSRGPNQNNQTVVTASGGGTVTVTVPEVDTGDNVASLDHPTVTDIRYDDIVKGITLRELQEEIGCFGTARGKLAILNTSLPQACSGQLYTAKIYADGGTPAGTSPFYTWASVGAPAWITLTAADNYYQLQGTPPSTGTSTLSVTVSDSDGNTVQRSFSLVVIDCGGGSDGQVNFTEHLNKDDWPIVETANPAIKINTGIKVVGMGDKKETAGCIWLPACSAITSAPLPPCDGVNYKLSGKTMRAYFEMSFLKDDDTESKKRGQGFTFTVMQGSNSAAVCGTGTGGTVLQCDPSVYAPFLGYCGIPGQTVAVEFDTYPTGDLNDPVNYNHVAIVHSASGHLAGFPAGVYADNTHNGPTGNPTCLGFSTPGCKKEPIASPSVTWLEDNAEHKARIELHTGCDATCSACGIGGAKAHIRVWIDCTTGTDPDCSHFDKLDVNYPTSGTRAPLVSDCFTLDASMNSVKIGFTESTGSSNQQLELKNFKLGLY